MIVCCSYFQDSKSGRQSPHLEMNSMCCVVSRLEGIEKKVCLTWGKTGPFSREIVLFGAVLGELGADEKCSPEWFSIGWEEHE